MSKDQPKAEYTVAVTLGAICVVRVPGLHQPLYGTVLALGLDKCTVKIEHKRGIRVLELPYEWVSHWTSVTVATWHITVTEHAKKSQR